MSEHTNRRRFLGTVERHSEDWQYEESCLVIGRSMSFRNRKFPDITLELFPRSFFTVRWTRNGEIDRWCYSFYSGKMYRTLDTMVSVLADSRGRRSRMIRGAVVAATGNIPMELAFDDSTLEYTLLTTLTRGEGSSGAFRPNWINFLSIPDVILDRVESRVSAIEARMTSPATNIPEEPDTDVKMEFSLGSDPVDQDEEDFVQVHTGPIRIIRV